MTDAWTASLEQPVRLQKVSVRLHPADIALADELVQTKVISSRSNAACVGFHNFLTEVVAEPDPKSLAYIYFIAAKDQRRLEQIRELDEAVQNKKEVLHKESKNPRRFPQALEEAKVLAANEELSPGQREELHKAIYELEYRDGQ